MMRLSTYIRLVFFLLLSLAVPPAGDASPRFCSAPNLEESVAPQDFVRLLQQIAHTHKISFVVESLPLDRATGDERLVQLVSDPTTPASVQVAALAARFDYRVVNKPGAFLLIKRHTNPLDFPEVSFPELRASLVDFITVLDGFMPPVDPDLTKGQPDRHYIARQLFDSLTPEQRERMKDRQQVVRVQDLPERQRAMAQQLALGGDIGDLRTEARKLLLILARVGAGKIAPMNDSNDAFGLATTRHGPGDQPVPVLEPLLTPTLTISRQANRNPIENECRRLLERPENIDNHQYETLNELAERLNKTASDGKQIAFSVDEALHNKRVVLVRGDALDPVQRFTWAAAVYGLHVVSPDPVTRRIIRLPLRRPDSPEKLFLSLRDTLPAPLLRFYHDGELDVARFGRDEVLRSGYFDWLPPNAEIPGEEEIRQRWRVIQPYVATLLNLRMASLRKRSPGQFPLLVSALKPQEGSWLVNYCVSHQELFASYATRRKRLAPVVAELNTLAIRVGQSEAVDYLGFIRLNQDGSQDGVVMSFSMTPPGYRPR